jgi:hypothetical protein
VGFVVHKVALGQVFSEYFGFPCPSSFHQLLHNHPHLSSGTGTVGQKWPQDKVLSPTPLEIKKDKFIIDLIIFGFPVFYIEMEFSCETAVSLVGTVGCHPTPFGKH